MECCEFRANWSWLIFPFCVELIEKPFSCEKENDGSGRKKDDQFSAIYEAIKFHIETFSVSENKSNKFF